MSQHYDREGFPLCPKYDEPVLSNDSDLCSLCQEHSASTTYYDHDSKEIRWMTVAQLKSAKGVI